VLGLIDILSRLAILVNEETEAQLRSGLEDLL
jgi:hypothetical protein